MEKGAKSLADFTPETLPLRCPVCGGTLSRQERVWRCPAGHSFDVARQGYVNLLPSNQKHSRHPGDSLLAVQARRAFLDGGWYAPLAARVAALAAAERPTLVLDAGCGEGYYLRAVGAATPAALRVGVDISREAVRYAAGRDKAGLWLCASAAALPLPDACCDVVLCMFAYAFPAEFARVLRPGGLLVMVTAAEDHLMALRRVIYPTLRQKEKPVPGTPAGFVPAGEERLEMPFTLTDPAQIANLLAMTPHYWRISSQGAAAAAALTQLEERAAVEIRCYRRAGEESAHG